MDRDTFLTLLTKKIAGELSEAEQLQLASVLETSQEYRQIHDGILLHTPTTDVKLSPEKKLATVWNNIESASQANKQRQMVPYRYLVAASVLIIVAVYWLASKYTNGAGNEQMITIHAHSQKLDTVLKDGTHLVLNENSELSLNKDFGEQTRFVILNGHAFFDVAKKTVPMVVQAGSVNITVKGTAFYVNNSGRRNTEVKLLRGLVEVSNRSDRNDKVLLKPNQRLSVAEAADHNLQYTIASLSVLDALVPVSNSEALSFNNKRLDLLVLLLEKRYNAKIEIGNEALKSKRFSGRFGTETLQEVLEALQFTYPFSFKATDKNIIIE